MWSVYHYISAGCVCECVITSIATLDLLDHPARWLNHRFCHTTLMTSWHQGSGFCLIMCSSMSSCHHFLENCFSVSLHLSPTCYCWSKWTVTLCEGVCWQVTWLLISKCPHFEFISCKCFGVVTGMSLYSRTEEALVLYPCGFTWCRCFRNIYSDSVRLIPSGPWVPHPANKSVIPLFTQLLHRVHGKTQRWKCDKSCKDSK